MKQSSHGSAFLKNDHKSTDSFPPKTMLHCYEGLISGCLAYLSKPVSVTKESVCAGVGTKELAGGRCTM